MKKILFYLLLVVATLTTVSILPQTVSTARADVSGTIDITWTYSDGSSIRLVGTITSWDNKGPHGSGYIIITIPGGGSYRYNVTFSYDGTFSDDPNGTAILQSHPEIGNYVDAWLHSQG